VLFGEAGFPPVEQPLDRVPLLRAADLRPPRDKSARRADGHVERATHFDDGVPRLFQFAKEALQVFRIV
jgi:hypothetical protein